MTDDFNISVFHTSEIPTAPAQLKGGPLDGQITRVPRFPDGSIPFTAELQYAEPVITSPRALYQLERDKAGETAIYVYVATLPPEDVVRESVPQPYSTSPTAGGKASPAELAN